MLDCPGKVALKILQVASTMEMTSFYFHYLLTSWDIHLLDLEEIVQDYVNITALQMIDVDDPHLVKAARGWGVTVMDPAAGGKLPVTTEAALMYDSMQLFVKAVRKAEEETPVSPEPMDCKRGQKWQQGGFLRDYMLNVMASNSFSKMWIQIRFLKCGFKFVF